MSHLTERAEEVADGDQGGVGGGALEGVVEVGELLADDPERVLRVLVEHQQQHLLHGAPAQRKMRGDETHLTVIGNARLAPLLRHQRHRLEDLRGSVRAERAKAERGKAANEPA